MKTWAWVRNRRRRYQDRHEDFSEELQAHLAHEIDDNMGRGMDHDQARSAALRKFGNPTAVKEVVHEMNTHRVLQDFLKDVWYSFRTLRKDWSFTALAVFLLALGIGGAAGVFQLVYAVLLRPLPLSHPERVVMLWSQYGKSPRVPTTLDDYADIRKRLRSFEGVAAYTSLLRAFESRTSRPEMVWTSYVSSNLFSILNARPYAGRLFSKEDDHLGGPVHIILGFGFWERHFGGDPTVIGQTVNLDHGKSATIIGIMPSDFQFPLEGMLPEGKSADVWSPFNEYPSIWKGPERPSPKPHRPATFRCLAGNGTGRPG